MRQAVLMTKGHALIKHAHHHVIEQETVSHMWVALTFPEQQRRRGRRVFHHALVFVEDNTLSNTLLNKNTPALSLQYHDS